MGEVGSQEKPVSFTHFYGKNLYAAVQHNTVELLRCLLWELFFRVFLKIKYYLISSIYMCFKTILERLENKYFEYY